MNQPIGYSAVDLGRSNSADNMMGTFIDDAIYDYLNTDAEPANDVDLFFNNAGGIRTDWCLLAVCGSVPVVWLVRMHRGFSPMATCSPSCPSEMRPR